MVDTNVQIIGELKSFLGTVIHSPELKKKFTQRDQDFSRERILTFERVLGIILNMPKRSLSIEVRDFFSSLSHDISCSKAAFSMQRSKLNPAFIALWNSFLVQLYYHYYGEQVSRWRNFLIYAVDGSTCYLVDKQEIIDYFGTQDNQYTSIPMAQVMQIHDVLNDIIVCGGIYPIRYSEQSIVSSKIESLPEDSITLFDRGYPSFALIYLLQNQERERLFVMRAKIGFNREVKRFMASSKTDEITYFESTESSIETLYKHGFVVPTHTKVKVRLVKVKLESGQTEILITNLYDQQIYTLKDLASLYFLRWGIETNYGKQKNQLQMEQFSGHRVVCIMQDYYATLFVANLQSLIEKQCEVYIKAVSKKRKHRYKVNKNISWSALKNNLFKLFITEHSKEILIYLQNLFERCLEPVRPNRKSKRTKKSKRMYGKYQTFTNYKRAI